MNHWGGPDSSSIPLGGCLLPRTSFDVGELFCLHPPLTMVVGLALLALIHTHVLCRTFSYKGEQRIGLFHGASVLERQTRAGNQETQDHKCSEVCCVERGRCWGRRPLKAELDIGQAAPSAVCAGAHVVLYPQLTWDFSSAFLFMHSLSSVYCESLGREVMPSSLSLQSGVCFVTAG